MTGRSRDPRSRPLLVSHRVPIFLSAWTYLWWVIAGLSVMLYPPRTYVASDLVITVAWGAILLGSCGVAVVGVICRRYVLEWSACYGMAVGFALYAYLSWGQALDSFGSIPRAAILTGLVGVPLARGTRLAIDDWNARRERLTRDPTEVTPGE